MRFTPLGFFPKRVSARPAWLGDPRVERIASVSTCISAGPDDWVAAWQHNDVGLYDTIDRARSVADGHGFELHGYRVADVAYDGGRLAAPTIPQVAADAIPEGWAFLGWDAVGRTSSWFDCSPLTCNGGSPRFDVNRHGLFASLEGALEGARTFSDPAGGWEPGPYYVVEVWAEPAR
jgi:hypothetical protein